MMPRAVTLARLTNRKMEFRAELEKLITKLEDYSIKSWMKQKTLIKKSFRLDREDQ
jgi:hypothetical protein